MVEEPTPLVEVDEKHRVLPRRARRDRRVNPIEKRFTGTNVVERMVIRTGPGRLAQERRVDVRHLRQRAGCAVGEEGIARAADRDVLSAPERQRRHVAEVVAALESPRGQAVPDRRQGREVERVADPVGLAGMLVHAVREGRGHDRAEVAIERRPLRHGAAEEREIVRLIVADREDVVRSKPAVTGSAVILDAPALVRMVGVGVATALEIGREGIGGVAGAGGIDVGESRLAPVGPGQPSQEVVERAVFHHHEHDVLDPRGLRIRQTRGRERGEHRDAGRAIDAGERESTGRGGGGGQECAARQWAGGLETRGRRGHDHLQQAVPPRAGR